MNRFIFVLAALAACDDATTGNTDSGDTGTTNPTCPNGNFVGDTQVDSVDVDCNSSGQGLLQATLTGVSAPGSAVMFLQETGNIEPQWSEEHHLDTVSTDECLAAETLEQVLEQVGVSVNDYVDGSATVFKCADHLQDPNVITAAVFVVDADDPSVTSCLVVGDDPAGLIAGNYDRAGVDPSFSLANCDIGTR